MVHRLKRSPAPKLSPLAKLMGRLAAAEGTHQTHLPGVQVTRRSQPQPRCPLVYEPGIIILGQGRKRLHLGPEVYTYDANNYLVLSVPLPVECEFDATPAHPLIGLSIDVDLTTLGELLLEMNEHLPAVSDTLPRGIYASPLTAALHDVTMRLLECLQSPVDSRVLGNQIKRELIYRVLQGEQGDALRAVAARHSHFGQISRVLRRLHQSYAEPMNVDALAREASMSVSAFHQKFRAVTLTSPIQYIKSIRLHKARLLMIQEGLHASAAALRVGYESASQFNREFKRLFEITPGQDAARIRRTSMQVVAE